MIDPVVVLVGALLVLAAAAVAYSLGVADRPYTDDPEPYTFSYDGGFIDAAWKAGHPAAIELPVAVLLAYADPAIVNRYLTRDRPKIDDFTEKLRAEGQTEPFELCIDGTGRAVLKDGYHRTLAIASLGVRTAGVVLIRSPRIPGWGRPLSDLFTDPELAASLRWLRT